MKRRLSSQQIILALGDAAAILIVTWVGFLSHYGTLKGARWLTSFLPALVGWWAVAPWLGLFQKPQTSSPRQLWRVAAAALVSAPLAATLRGFWLGSDIPPTFVLVFGLTNALGLLIWRAVWWGVTRRKVRHG